MIRASYVFLVFWFYQILILPRLFRSTRLYKQGKKEESRELASETAYNWAHALLGAAGAKVHLRSEVELDPKQAYYVVSNHQGAFDIPLLLGYLGIPVAFVAKIELRKIPLLGRWMANIGCIFLDRGNRRAAVTCMKETIAELQNGHSMVIFPEGTRSNCSTMGEFKKGSLSMGVKSGVPILPVTIKGSYKLRKGNAFGVQPAEVEIIIHEPIPTEGLNKEEKDGMTDRVRDIIASAT